MALVFAGLKAQEDFTAPDMAVIEQVTKDASSPFYFDRLMEKYLNGDAELSIEESRHLYYGYVFQPGYVPTDTSSYNNRLAEVLSRNSFSASDYADIVLYSDELLKEDPFNLRALNAKMLVYAQQDKSEEYKKVARQRRVVQDAIISTGDGMSENSAYYVIKVAHEYDILPFLGFSFASEDKKLLKNKTVNSLSLGQNKFGIDKIYFNISPIIDYVSNHGGGIF